MKSIRMLLLPVLALALGLCWQLWHPNGLIGKKNAPKTSDGFQRISWEAAQSRVTSGEWLLIDARPEDQFEALHIPGAVSLPSHSYPEALLFFLEEHGKERPALVYCSSTDCDSSVELAKRLRELGHKELRILDGGFLSWQRTQP